MNRRGFFGWIAAAIGWLWGVKAETPITAAAALKMKARFESVRIIQEVSFLKCYKWCDRLKMAVDDGCWLTVKQWNGSGETIRLRFVPTVEQLIRINRDKDNVKAILGIG